VLPNDFIPFAENSGLIEPLGEWILRQACRQAARWHQQGQLPGRMAVNISSVQVHHGNILEKVCQALTDSGLPANRLELEITESTLMPNSGPGLRYLKTLREMGVHIAVDDFGTGYSSFSYLQRLPIDTLKIDRTFVRHLPEETKDVAIIRSIVSLAIGLGLKVVAEGVETDEQRVFLTEIGCMLGQGWLLGKPLEPGAFAERYFDTGTIHRKR
jgi:EAL domain-containing protein (putative c-di-GMP-specific phosphodiesterase class I)